MLNLARWLLAAAVMASCAVVATHAQETKQTTLKGTILCAHCALNETKECQTAIQVKDGDKLVTYYLLDKGEAESYHNAVCGGEKKTGTVIGIVSMKDGKQYITPKKVEYDKN